MALALPWKHHDDFTDPQRIRENFERIRERWDVTSLLTVRGVITSAGGIDEGTGFTITKGATGLYTINFDPAFADIPSVVAIPREGNLAADIRHNAAATASSAQLAARTSGGTLADSGFHFIAIGPR